MVDREDVVGVPDLVRRPPFEDVRDLVKEGIEIIPFAAPTRIELAGGRLKVTFTRMKPGAPDASGRPRPVAMPGSEYVEEYDQVVTAVGERAGFSELPPTLRHDQGLVTTDFSSSTNLEGVFAGGDLSNGFGTVAHAIRSGRKAADAIHAYLAGKVR